MTTKYLAGRYGGEGRDTMGPVKGWKPPKEANKVAAAKKPQRR